MHFQSLLALALLASPAFAHAGKRAPLDGTLVNASLFERYVASHLRARRPANINIKTTAQPAVYRPRKINTEVVPAIIDPRAPYVREAGSHLAHAVWRPVAEGHSSTPIKSKFKRDVVTPAEHKRSKVAYRNAYLARAAAKRRGLVAEPVVSPKIEQRAVVEKPRIVKRGLVEDEAWSKVKREFEAGFEQEEGDVEEDEEEFEDFSWMDHGEEAEGDEESSAGSLRRRSAELIDERSPVMRMETRMRRTSPLVV